jgi:hypothetical protein
MCDQSGLDDATMKKEAVWRPRLTSLSVHGKCIFLKNGSSLADDWCSAPPVIVAFPSPGSGRLSLYDFPCRAQDITLKPQTCRVKKGVRHSKVSI